MRGARYCAARRVAYYNELLGKISSTPGVLAVGAIAIFRRLGSRHSDHLLADGHRNTRADTAATRRRHSQWDADTFLDVSPLRVAESSRQRGAPVAIISEALSADGSGQGDRRNMIGRTIARRRASNLPSTVVRRTCGREISIVSWRHSSIARMRR